jgi:hypothetical protein
MNNSHMNKVNHICTLLSHETESESDQLGTVHQKGDLLWHSKYYGFICLLHYI